MEKQQGPGIDLKHFLSDPKVMAASGLITWLFKLIIFLFVYVLLFFLEGPSLLHHNATLRIFYPPVSALLILYPPISLAVDLLLHLNRKKIWRWTPDPNTIPIDWETTPEALLNYAAHGPTVRLMRLVACWTPVAAAMIPLRTPVDASRLLEIMLGLGLGFFFFALFDRVWASVLNIQTPSLLTPCKSLWYSLTMLAQAGASTAAHILQK